jgi:hypothetical protein
MILWMCALGLVAATAVVGYYQGAVRAAMTLAGLVLASLIVIPLGDVIKPLVVMCGVQHPVLLAFLGPVAVFVLLMIIVKTAAIFVHKKVEHHYKYAVSDTQRMLWERLNQRLGTCVGVVNGTFYVLALSVLVYEAGYPLVQMSSDRDSVWLRSISTLSQDMQATRMVKAIAPFAPAAEIYYDVSDLLALIYRNPLLQNRLTRYPTLIMVAEQPDFQALGKDVNFQQTWAGQPPIEEFISHDKLKPMVSSIDVYSNLLNIVAVDIKDLRDFLLTGKSARYDEERILGRWDFDPRTTFTMARRRPSITTVELRRLRNVLNSLNNATLIATVDHKAIVKTTRNSLQGSWNNNGPSEYKVSITEGTRRQEGTARIEGTRLLLGRDGFSLVFEK